MGKLEETFNIPELIDDLEEAANMIESTYQEETPLDKTIARFQDSLSEDELTQVVDLNQYDKEMDEIATATMREFEDLATLGKDVEIRSAGDIFSAAAQMAKIALDAKTNKTNARLKILELSIRRKRNELLEDKQNFEMGKNVPAEVTEATAMDRNDILRMAEEIKKS